MNSKAPSTQRVFRISQGSTPEEDVEMSNEGGYRQRLSAIAAKWRVLALRGLIALLIGLVLLFRPGLILAVLSLLFGPWPHGRLRRTSV